MDIVSDEVIVICPHCLNLIIIEEINCRIFRHGIYKNGEPLPPHSTKEECDEAVSKGIYGCGRPFILDMSGNQWIASKCEYI